MPTYDYVCEACGHELEIFHSMSEAPKRKCPRCGKLRLSRRIGAGAGFVFKGSGFYLTDYRSSSYKEGEKAARAGEGSPSADAKKAESETKPAASEPASSADSSAAKASAPKAEKPAPAPKKKPAKD